MSLHLWIIPLLPLTGAAINGLLGKRFPKAVVNAIALGSTAAAFAYALYVAIQFVGLQAHGLFVRQRPGGCQVNRCLLYTSPSPRD